MADENMTISSLVPNPDDLLALEVEEFAGVLLPGSRQSKRSPEFVRFEV